MISTTAQNKQNICDLKLEKNASMSKKKTVHDNAPFSWDKNCQYRKMIYPTKKLSLTIINTKTITKTKQTNSP